MKARLYRIFAEISRHHISLMLAITLFDLILIRMRETITVCFSFLLPQRLMIWGNRYIEMAQAKVDSFELMNFYICTMVAICFALFVICLVCSYRRAGWLLCAASMMLIDTALVIGLLIESRDVTYVLDLVAHVWIIAALVAGYLFERARKAELNRLQEALETGEEIACEAMEQIESMPAEETESETGEDAEPESEEKPAVEESDKPEETEQVAPYSTPLPQESEPAAISE